MNIKAKMRCASVTKYDAGAGGYEGVKLTAVYSDSPENKTFSAATPTASVEMTISNPAAFGAFVPGAEYYVDFSPAAAK